MSKLQQGGGGECCNDYSVTEPAAAISLKRISIPRLLCIVIHPIPVPIKTEPNIAFVQLWGHSPPVFGQVWASTPPHHSPLFSCSFGWAFPWLSFRFGLALPLFSCIDCRASPLLLCSLGRASPHLGHPFGLGSGQVDRLFSTFSVDPFWL